MLFQKLSMFFRLLVTLAKDVSLKMKNITAISLSGTYEISHSQYTTLLKYTTAIPNLVLPHWGIIN